jgi:hypothetical protein
MSADTSHRVTLLAWIAGWCLAAAYLGTWVWVQGSIVFDLARMEPVEAKRTFLVVMLSFFLSWLIAATLIGIAVYLRRRTSRWAWLLLPAGLCLLTLCYVTPYPNTWLDRARSAGFHRVVANARPLIAAIEAYRRSHMGQPPATLHDLAPTYLPAVPGTGIRAYPVYFYAADHEGFRLSVSCPSGMIDFSQFLYDSQLGQSDRHTYGEVCARDGGWIFIRD